MAISPDSQVAPELIALQEAVVGRFSLVRELGRGGMGIVFLARDVALDRPVAIKLLPPELALSAQHRDRFVREARMAARLSHPHIVPIHAVEERGSLVFFVMSYVDGDTLSSRVSREGPLEPGEARRIMREVAWALGHAHANGIVHRDVKPENILIEHGSGRAMVTDFGIAQAADGPNSSARGRIAGTPRYMSPEQAAGDQLDGRSDIYSLGAVAYFAVTGRSPFDGPSAAALLVKHLNEPVPSVRAVRTEVPLELAAAIERCLAKSPADRYQTADDLAHSLAPASDAIAAPVAAFLRDMDVAGGEIGTALSALVSSLFMIALTVREPANASFSDALSLTVALVLFTGAAATMTGLVIVRLVHIVDRIRQFLRSGYGHSAVLPGLRAAAADPPSSKPSALSVAARIAGTVAAVALSRGGSGWLPVVGAAGGIVIPTVALRQLWTDRKLWPRALAGRIGKMLFRVASIGLSGGEVRPAAGEPTAIAIGHAAGDLFRALPDSVRAQYAQLPEMIDRLETEALRNRARVGDPQAEARFTQAITALESLRLDLLRIHAGAAPRGELTGSIDAARRLGAEIDARLSAAGEVDQALRNSTG